MNAVDDLIRPSDSRRKTIQVCGARLLGSFRPSASPPAAVGWWVAVGSRDWDAQRMGNDDVRCPLCRSAMVISQWMDVPGRRIPLEYDCPRHCRDGVSSEIYDEAIERQHDQTSG